MDDALYDVGQRLDALAADDERAYHHSAANALAFFQGDLSRVGAPHANTNANPNKRKTKHMKRRAFALTSLLGTSAFYLRVALAIHVGWCFIGYNFAATTIVSLRESAQQMLQAAANAAAASSSSTVTSTGSGLRASPAQLFSPGWPWTRLAAEFVATAWGAAIGSAVFGSFADHYGRRRVLLAATSLWLVAHIVVANVHSERSAVPVSEPNGAIVMHALGHILEGMGFGGQLVLFPMVPVELAAQRHRGRLVALSYPGVILGAVAATYTTNPLIDALGGDTRVFRGVVLSGLAVLFLLALGCLVRESPRFLAASGRIDAALREVERIELAHGVRWRVRHHSLHATTSQQSPLSLPCPVLQPNCQPLPPPSRPLPSRAQASARSIGALAPRMVSLGVSLRRRWVRALCRRPYRSRSLGLALFWLLVPTSLMLAVAGAGRFVAIDLTTAVVSTAIAGCLSFAITAAYADSCGRVGMLSGALMVDALGIALVGLQLRLAADHGAEMGRYPTPRGLSIAICVLLGAGMACTLATGAVWTVEHFGVMVRGTGVGHAVASAWLGVAAAVWIMLSSSTPHPSAKATATATATAGGDDDASPPYASLAVNMTIEGAAITVWIGSGLLLLLAAFIRVRGLETCGREDSDMVMIGDEHSDAYGPAERTAVRTKHLPSHETDASDSPTPPWLFVGYDAAGGSMRSLCLSSDDEGGGVDARWHAQSMTDVTQSFSSESSALSQSRGEGGGPRTLAAEEVSCSPLYDRRFLNMSVAQREVARLATQDMLTIETDPFEGMGEGSFSSGEHLTPQHAALPLPRTR